MYRIMLALIICLFSLLEVQSGNKFYIANQKPLVEQPYMPLPLGSIRPQGMLLEMLNRQRDGLTGCMDSVYNVVCGDRNGWLGGTGDGWERGPYWIDGLLPLAYILDDQTLKEKALKWVEWSLNNQREDGNFGPKPLPEGYIKMSGVQQEMRDDWWPKMVMLKVLQQYYMATEDKRVIDFMIRYFKYQQETLPKYPLGHWTFWANRRGSDNLAIVYWLYNVTKEKFLLALGELLHQQTYDWTEIFSSNKIRTLNPYPSLHCVNVAQGLKSPIIYYQRHPDEKYLNAVKEGLSALKDCHGFVNGMFGGDERLHGNDPTQGSELCTAVEMMYSFESILPITGDVYYADYLEKIAYNVLPTQITDDFMYKQYFQQTNQILVSADTRNFFNDDNGRLAFGRITGCSCCLTNMHQGWPKFVQNLWYATADNGLAALVYGASKVTAKVGDGQTVTIIEDTDYPFKESVRFTIHTSENVRFPLHLRIPLWCKSVHLKVNNEEVEMGEDNITVINRRWKSGDTVELVMDMNFRFTRWYENSLGIERGPLVYALKVMEDWRKIGIEGMTDKELWEVYPKSAWNYAILDKELKKGALNLSVSDTISDYPWNLKNAPIQIRAKAVRLPEWRTQNHSAGKIMVPPRVKKDSKNAGSVVEDITLVPYGCTTLRISQFPVIE